jgi:hypothetical protein
MGSSSRASGAMAGDAGDMNAPNTGELEFQNARWLSVLQECVLCLPKTMHVCVCVLMGYFAWPCTRTPEDWSFCSSYSSSSKSSLLKKV